jgi:oxidase EvaA
MEDLAWTSSRSFVAEDDPVPSRIAESALCRDGKIVDLVEFNRWFARFSRHMYTRVERIPLNGLAGWNSDPRTGNISHHSGKFFTIEGLDIHIWDRPVPEWSQPIINQSEVGILGILVKEFDGVLHFLMQAKAEPGNCNGLQLSPTVQATRSNYSRVHRGHAVPYLEHFLNTSRARVIVDVRQSEHGAWFYRKRNRNMVVEIDDDVELHAGFCWLSLGQVHQLLAVDHLINMDARTVLACLPFASIDSPATFDPRPDGFRSALARSCSKDAGGVHTMTEVLSWITDARTRTSVQVSRIPVNALRRWSRSDEKISHESGLFFEVIGVSVEAGGREVEHWTQPMIATRSVGVVAFIVRRVRGVLHILVHARVEPGYVDVVELGPTVQCAPEDLEYLPSSARPLFLDEVLRAGPAQVRFEATLSEEGGRFYRARNRYLIIEAHSDIASGHPEFRWLTLHQLGNLLRHSHYVNVQARSLVACLHSLFGVP